MGMTFKEYQEVKAINASFLKSCSFGEYAGYMYLNQPPYESKSMAIGTAIHAALLEPHSFSDQVAIIPTKESHPNALDTLDDYKAMATKLGLKTSGTKDKLKAAILEVEPKVDFWDDTVAFFHEANKHKLVIDLETAKKVDLCVRKAREIPLVKEALNSFLPEQSFVWDSIAGKMKARLDLVNFDAGIIIDVKTTGKSADQASVVKQLIDLRYDIQFYHYCEALKAHGVNCPKVYVIYIETETGETAIYDVNAFMRSDFTEVRYIDSIYTAQKVLNLKECPPKYPRAIVNLGLPAWIKE